MDFLSSYVWYSKLIIDSPPLTLVSCVHFCCSLIGLLLTLVPDSQSAVLLWCERCPLVVPETPPPGAIPWWCKWWWPLAVANVEEDAEEFAELAADILERRLGNVSMTRSRNSSSAPTSFCSSWNWCKWNYYLLSWYKYKYI